MAVERVLWVACAALTLSACEYEHVGPRRSVTTETRAVASFDAIEFEGDARLEISVGEPAEVVIRGQPGVVKSTLTRVAGNTLHIEVGRKNWNWSKDRQRLTLQIKVPQLRSLRLDGGNVVRLKGFKGGESSISVNGAASIRASGELDQLTVHLAGAGHADLSRLAANAAKVTVDGVGSVLVNSKESLDATMNGVGAIFYSGSPRQVNSSMNGFGTISKRDERRTRHRGWDRGDWGRDADSDSEPEREAEADTI
jgi:hypothetical protein